MRNIILFSLFLIFGIIIKSYFFSETAPVSSYNSKKKISTPIPPTVRYLSKNTRYNFTINGITAQIPYASNLLLEKDHPEITQLILAIHSSSYNPDYYLENSLILLQDNPEQLKKTLIMAPAFYRKDKTSLSNIMVWRSSPFWGSSRALYHEKKINLSSYDILDDILTRIISSNHFPNLTNIVILGHSAGGQLVNRYAACNTVEDTIAIKKHISIRYLVMAPSSYVYMDGERATRDDLAQFKHPFNAYKKYNYWGYGLKHLYGYHKRRHITEDMIRLQYRYREVLYLVGEEDTTDAALDKSKSAMLEGKNRLERLKTYYDHLQNHYGQDITEFHHMAIIKGVGHSSRKLMLSNEGKRFILRE